ncbi:MAG: hypothetical protein OXB98_01040 [Bryobacterales bacterium]|nr:hypothetical protein [Bryobacterales bacterium]
MRKVTISEIRNFLREQKNIERMIEATEKGRPAVEPLQDDILVRFGPFTRGARADWVKQRFGQEARYVMEANGYMHAEYGVEVDGPLFSVASRYKKV